MRVSFVGYRDKYDSVMEYPVCDFSEDIEYIKEFISNVRCGSGGDCEDIAGGFEFALK